MQRLPNKENFAGSALHNRPMTLQSNVVRRFLDNWPGKKRLGVYRFLPIFFVLGAALEFSMINWTVGETNFCEWNPFLIHCSILKFPFSFPAQIVPSSDDKLRTILRSSRCVCNWSSSSSSSSDKTRVNQRINCSTLKSPLLPPLQSCLPVSLGPST